MRWDSDLSELQPPNKIMMKKPAWVLVLFLILGAIYAITTPVFEASDELWHYPFVRHLADGNPLPVQDPDHVGPWKQEASQQPLYYALAAALTFWIDTSDMDSVRWLNPHVDNGILTQDGNKNLVIHRPETESSWSGVVLAVRLIRLFSVLLSAGTVYMTWRIARFVLPQKPYLAVGAAAVNAFTPMFLFVSGAVNNDSLSMLLCATALFLMLKNGAPFSGSQGDGKPNQSIKDSLLLGLVLGLAALTKTSALGLIALALLSLVVSTFGQVTGDGWRSWLINVVRHSLVIVAPVILIAGWWYYRNYVLYGDWLGWSAFIQILGRRAHPANLTQLWGERWGFSLSYWGLFGGVNVPMAEWIYHLLNWLAVAAAAGLVIYLGCCLRDGSHKTENHQSIISRLAALVLNAWPLILMGGWTVGVFLGLVRWARITWSSQGRLVFPAISALSILLVAGLFGCLPRKAGKWGVTLLGGFLFVISAIAPFAWIAPAYQPPPEPTAADIAAIQHPMEVDFGGQIRLLGYDLLSTQVETGGQLELDLYWEALAPMDRNWSVFVHLNDTVIGAPIAQRDMYLGQGLLATTLLTPGQRVRNHYVIQVPETVYAPARVDLVVGLYDYTSGERLVTGEDSDVVFLSAVDVESSGQNEYPNPVSLNFGNQVALVGYEVQPRRLQAGETLAVTLYWQALADLQNDYTVFTHLRDVEDPSNRIYGQHDAPLPERSSWSPGTVHQEVYTLALAQDTPAAVHEIEVGIYYRDTDGNIERLQLVTPDGRLVDDFAILGKVRVD